MRIAIDAHVIGRQVTGNEVYIRNLLKAFPSQRPSCELLAYVSSSEARREIPVEIQTRLISANPFLRLGFDLARQIRKDRPDLLHVQYTSPIASHVPVVVTVHDVSFLEHPEFFPPARARQLTWTVRRTVNRAERIITGSQFSRASILKRYAHIPADRVVAIPHAAGSEFRPMPPDAAAAAVRERFSIAEPFILSVGDLQPRKNHVRLIRAFSGIVRAHPHLRHQLVLAGQETWFAPRVRQAAEASGVADRIQFVGFVRDADLVALYNACDVCVYPSLYEGFGLPTLEAMACGAAVACSNTSAMPEVVGAAAAGFDPQSADDIARAITALLVDRELRARMARLGLARAAQFSWATTSARTLEIFEQVVEERRRRERT